MRSLRVFWLLSVFMLITLSPGRTQHPYQWRGLDRMGIYPSDSLLREWPENGPERILLMEDLPQAFSSVVARDSVIYTTGIVEEDELLTALDHRGNILWQTRYGDAWERSFPNGRSTPTVGKKAVYVISGSGDLAAVDRNSGELIWSVDGLEKYSGKTGRWGVAESPLIVDDKMIYTPCGDVTTLVAVDKHTGETIWMTESLEDQSGYASPALLERGPYKLIITVTGNWVVCVDSENGELLWKAEYTRMGEPEGGKDINPVTPVAVGNEVFITSGYDHAGIMFQMAEDYRSAEVKWVSKDLDVHHGGVVAYDGYLYGANWENNRMGQWVCLDWDTGEVRYEEEWNNKGSIVMADGMFYCYEEKRGHLALVEPDPTRFRVISQFRVEYGEGPHWAHPSIYDGKLYVRHGKALGVYDIAAD